jgi:tRNA(Arg) A34 adenosine deaminase TadA
MTGFKYLWIMKDRDQFFMQRAIFLAEKGMTENAGGPFGAVVVKNDQIIGEGYNSVTSSNDPTAHAEVLAIRNACRNLGSHQLKDCTIYTSCEPCPMCLGAIYWARPLRVVYACQRDDAAAIDFDDQFIYDEMEHSMNNRKIEFLQLMREEALSLFRKWSKKIDRIKY